MRFLNAPYKTIKQLIAFFAFLELGQVSLYNLEDKQNHAPNRKCIQ